MITVPVICMFGALLTSSAAFTDGAPTVYGIRVDAQGHPSGVILSDGMEYLATGVDAQAIADSFRRGDSVFPATRGERSIVLEDGRTHLRATVTPVDASAHGNSINDRANDASREQSSQLPRLVVRGRIALVTHDTHGTATGLVMENGVQVHVAQPLASVLVRVHRGDAIHAEGFGRSGEMGVGMWASEIETPGGIVSSRLPR